MTDIYKNPAQSIENRVADLLARMSVEEKIAQMHAFWLLLSDDGRHQVREDTFTGADDGDRLKEKLSSGLGQITRPLGSRPVDPAAGVRALNRLQKFLVEETRLGIPVIAHEECLSGIMAQGGTLFPSSLAFGATFDPALIEEVGRVIGQEARSIGCRQGLAPVLDVARDARWGRTEETFGEDPYHVGLLASRYVRGLQGRDRDFLATLKHYAGHSLSEGARNHAPVNLGWRELNDTFLLPFEMAVRLSDAGSVMPAYHDIDGEPCHASHHLLTKVLREDWGFDGLVVADYIGISLLYKHHGVAADAAEAAALAFKAGLDVELPGDDCAAHLKAALARGLIGMDMIDAIVRRILTEKMRLGLFEHPYTDEAGIALQTPEAIDVARRVAQKSVVILANDGILPLAEEKTIALIGPTADDPLALLGDYSFPVHLIVSDLADTASSVITPRAAFEARFGTERVRYAKGCHILEARQSGAPVFPGDVPDMTTLSQTSPVSTSLDLIPAAVEAARQADVAVVCVGDLSGIFQTGTVGEGSDTDTLALPGVQQALLEAVVETGTPVIVVITSGRPYTLGGLEDHVAAQVMAFFGGQEGGAALADVLTGVVEPSGRLSISVPRSAGASPYFYNHKFKSAGTPVARHFGSRYPFGHGLSYTRFVYEDITLDRSSVQSDEGSIGVSFTLRNVGARGGTEVPQLYVRDLVCSVVRPIKELKAFRRVFLEAGESACVTFRIPTDMFSFTGQDGFRIVEPGMFELMIGSSSAAIHLRSQIEVKGPVRRIEGDWKMVSRAFVSHP
ncbi:glycoside hydrolase family 3 C-terminal domain-containing protein [Rhizobium sp. DKSPLA3]|uniref:Beta-D-glucoside glucohydrolase n=1 Tax=Rhizobium quercicola TaxID=2901226 RepID=A0A9X1NP63_9HYPH|nr:glycoside hydrolase family 3 N-terminal domain-containing protein [Rhizobium quercicola]MCD7107474.1 glycoside hydrolase family 3 C-terminal domain-containing protein [Rhizobium quercicola]